MVFSNYIDTYVHNLQLGPEMYFKHILFITACHIHQHVHRPVRMYHTNSTKTICINANTSIHNQAYTYRTQTHGTYTSQLPATYTFSFYTVWLYFPLFFARSRFEKERHVWEKKMQPCHVCVSVLVRSEKPKKQILSIILVIKKGFLLFRKLLIGLSITFVSGRENFFTSQV